MNKPTLENFNELVKTKDGVKAIFDYVSNLEAQKDQLKKELNYFENLVEKLNLKYKKPLNKNNV